MKIIPTKKLKIFLKYKSVIFLLLIVSLLFSLVLEFFFIDQGLTYKGRVRATHALFDFPISKSKHYLTNNFQFQQEMRSKVFFSKIKKMSNNKCILNINDFARRNLTLDLKRDEEIEIVLLFKDKSLVVSCVEAISQYFLKMHEEKYSFFKRTIESKLKYFEGDEIASRRIKDQYYDYINFFQKPIILDKRVYETSKGIMNNFFIRSIFIMLILLSFLIIFILLKNPIILKK